MLSRLEILEHVIDPERGDFPPELARRLLQFDFPPSDHAKYHELSEKAQDGALTADEREELENYLSVNDLLMVLRAKATASLRAHHPAA